jgi:AcrR family transcriptional regulator
VLDGRLARSARTRDRLADAWLALLDGGELRPSAAAVAERAGVSVRVVFHHFEDMDALFSAVAERQIARVLAEAKPPLRTEGPRDARLDDFVARRTGILEHVAPVRRAALLSEPFSAEIERRLGWSRQLAREEVRRAFAPELARLAPGARAEVMEALAVAASWPTWDELRRHYGLSARRAAAVMRRTLAALLRDPA